MCSKFNPRSPLTNFTGTKVGILHILESIVIDLCALQLLACMLTFRGFRIQVYDAAPEAYVAFAEQAYKMRAGFDSASARQVKQIPAGN